jgi:hypothetical protein
VLTDPFARALVLDGGSTPQWWDNFGILDREALSRSPIGSPLWMAYRGIARLTAENAELTRCENYWQGRHDPPDTLDRETAERYAVLVGESQINYMRTVVEVIAERIKLQGLWLPGDDERADSATWEIWEANGLTAWQSVAWAEMLAKRRVYFSVWYGEGADAMPRIELEDALQTWVEFAPGSRTERAFGVKSYVDDWTGAQIVDVATPTALHYFMRRDNTAWTPYRESGVNRLGAVPFVPMVNRPTLRTADKGYSVIEDVIKTQDRLNQTVLGRMLAGHTAAFMQKWATGIEIEDDDDGNPVAPFKPGVTKLWTSEHEAAKFGQFDATDLTNYITGEEQEIQHIANTTRLPRHYLNPTGQAPSGDAMRSAEAALVASVGTIQQFSTASLKEVLRLARLAKGMGETPILGELVWADPEYQTYAQLVDGTTKLTSEGIASKRWGREKVGMTPATITRVESELEEEALLAELMAPEVEPAIQESAPPAGQS